MKRKVFCTSTGCLEYAPERYLKENAIDIIRVHVIYNGKEYLEGIDLDPVDFYNALENVKDVKNNLPYTAMPTRGEICAHFDKAVEEGYTEAFVIVISSALGGTYNLIRLIAEEYSDKIKIHVIDSRITCFGEGLLAVQVAQMIEKGVDSEQILKEVEWLKAHQEFIGVDGRLDYLIYNGRLKGGKAFFGKMLQICPVIHFSREGECVPLHSVRTQKKALHKTCEVLKETLGNRSKDDYILFHIYTGTSLITQLDEIEKEYGIECNHEPVIMSPVSGCHNGPWLAGYGLMLKRREDEPLE